jgi:hypothetical protein
MAVDFTPWVANVSKFKAAEMNAPLTELKESAQVAIDEKADASHEHVVADVTDFPATMPPDTHNHAWTDITDPPSIGTGDMLGSNNLSELTDAGTARGNLGLGDAAVADIGTSSGDVAAGDHGHTIEGSIGIGFEETAKPIASGAYSLIIPYEMVVPANASTSGYYGKTNPTAQVVVSIKDDGTEIATLTVATNGTPTWATGGGTAKTIAAGSRVSFVFPAQDATWAGVVITLKGTRDI